MLLCLDLICFFHYSAVLDKVETQNSKFEVIFSSQQYSTNEAKMKQTSLLYLK